MTRHLVVRLGGPLEAEWLILDGPEQSPKGPRRGALSSVAAETRGARVSVLVPGADVLMARASLPAMHRQRLIKAVPYALEDQLAEDVESLHFALGKADESGLLAVGAVSRQRMDEWHGALQAAGITPAMMTPDMLAVPWNSDGWSILLAEEQALVRTGPQDGFAVETDNLLPLLRLQLEAAGEARPAAIHLHTVTPDAAISDDLAELEIPVSEHVAARGVLDCLAGGLGDRQQINLLQDAYAPEEPVVQLLRPWRPAAAMLAVWLLLVMMGGFLQTWDLRRERQALAERIQQVFRQTFPDVRRVVDAKVQMERQLAKLRKEQGNSPTGFLALLTAGAISLQQVDGVEIQGLQYRQGRLELDLTLPSMSRLDPLRQALQQAGELDASVVSARAREGLVEGKIRITGKQG